MRYSKRCALSWVSGFVVALMLGSAQGATPLPHGEGYELHMEVSVDGKPVSSPHLIVRRGERATLVQTTRAGSQSIEVIATEGTVEEHPGILLQFSISSVDHRGHSVVAHPQILARAGAPARITEKGPETGGALLSLSVTAERKQF